MLQKENYKILVVEDKSFDALPLLQMLKEEGYQVAPLARTGIAALQIFEAEQPHLVLMDIGLPEDAGIQWNGIQAAQELLKKRKIPIIFLTAYSEQSLVNTALQQIGAGIMEYVTKPYKMRDLQIMIQKQLMAFYPIHPQKQFSFKNHLNHAKIISTQQILYIERKEEHVHIVCETESFKFSANLTVFEKGNKFDISALPHFIRVHRSFIINTHFIEGKNLSISRPFVTMKNGITISINMNFAQLKAFY